MPETLILFILARTASCIVDYSYQYENDCSNHDVLYSLAVLAFGHKVIVYGNAPITVLKVIVAYGCILKLVAFDFLGVFVVTRHYI